MFRTALIIGGLLVAPAPSWPSHVAAPEEPKRPPPWEDRWKPPRPPETPEPETPVDGAAFASDCNDDGVVLVDTDLEVRGGSGTLSTDCRIEIGAAAALALIDVTLAGPYAFQVQCGVGARLLLVNSYLTLFTRIGVDGEAGTALVIRDSEVSSVAGGAIEIVLNGGETAFEVLDSMIMSDGAALIDVSPRADGGRIEVRNATLAAGGAAASALLLAASIDGLAGEAAVLESHLIGAALIAIETGAQGRTEVRDNIIETPGEVRIAAGDGGHCESTGNDPALTCPQLVEEGATAVATVVSRKSEDR